MIAGIVLSLGTDVVLHMAHIRQTSPDAIAGRLDG
jgi:hypothetical protein